MLEQDHDESEKDNTSDAEVGENIKISPDEEIQEIQEIVPSVTSFEKRLRHFSLLFASRVSAEGLMDNDEVPSRIQQLLCGELPSSTFESQAPDFILPKKQLRLSQEESVVLSEEIMKSSSKKQHQERAPVNLSAKAPHDHSDSNIDNKIHPTIREAAQPRPPIPLRKHGEKLKPAECFRCHKKFLTRLDLAAHVRSAHLQGLKKPLQCKKCKKIFIEPRHLYVVWFGLIPRAV
jgi:hypothetical protein